MRAAPLPVSRTPVSRLPVAGTLVALVLACAGAAARAQDVPSPPRPGTEPVASDTTSTLAAEKADRRGRARSLAGPGALLLVLSPPQEGGVPGSNRNPDFEYLSPVEAREAALLVAGPRTAAPVEGVPSVATSAGDAGIDRLYVPLRNPGTERWTGPEPGPGPETAAAAAFHDVRAIDQLADDLVAALRGRTTLWVSAGPAGTGGPALAKLVATVRERLPGKWIRIVDAPGAGRDDLVESIRRALPARSAEAEPTDVLSKLPAVDVRSARAILSELREVKSAAEVERIRAAVRATVEGHADAMRAARPGLFEYHLVAIFEMRCRAGGCRRQAYPTIAGSGPNSCVLHYDRNRRKLEDGDLVVMDAGGEYEGYACDVTRTFPVSGRFTDEQAKVYDAVLEAQEAAIAAVKPGVTLRQVHDVAFRVLDRHGLSKWFIHGTCHAVGLEVHDAWRRDSVLRPGCVITVEPGVYDAARNLGVRIEDTVLVTETGCEVLSAALPKTRAAVEALLREDPPAGLPR